MKKIAEERLAKILELQATIEKAQASLEELLVPTPITPPPPGFSYSEEVLSIIIESGDSGVARSDILIKLQSKYPEFGKNVDIKQIAATLAYLKNVKKRIDVLARGVYKIKE